MKAVPLILWAGLTILPLTGLCAQNDSEAKPDPFTLKLSGEHTFLYGVPVGKESWDTGYQGEMKLPKFKNELGLEASQGQLDLNTKWELTSTAQENRVRNLESAVVWNPEGFRLGFGWQIFSWGTADGVNPTDNLNPRDYTTIEGNKPHKLPALAADAVWYPSEQVSLEAVFVPSAGTSIYPTDYVQALTSQGLTASAKDNSSQLKNFVAGGKFNFRSTALDFSLSYLSDVDGFYTPSVADNFAVTLERKRIHRIGADMKTTLDRFGLWAEACWSQTGNFSASDYTERLSRLDYTLGFDFSYGPGDDYYVNFQYTGTVIPGYDKGANTYASSDPRYLQRNLAYSLAGMNQGLLQGVTWNAHWNLAGGTVVPTFTGSYSVPFFYDDSSLTRLGSLLLRPEVDFMPVDSFHITAGSILAWAWTQKSGQTAALDTTDLSGVYTPQNKIYLNVSYKWNTPLTK